MSSHGIEREIVGGDKIATRETGIIMLSWTLLYLQLILRYLNDHSLRIESPSWRYGSIQTHRRPLELCAEKAISIRADSTHHQC